jgi:hypothetical protein
VRKGHRALLARRGQRATRVIPERTVRLALPEPQALQGLLEPEAQPGPPEHRDLRASLDHKVNPDTWRLGTAAVPSLIKL